MLLAASWGSWFKRVSWRMRFVWGIGRRYSCKLRRVVWRGCGFAICLIWALDEWLVSLMKLQSFGRRFLQPRVFFFWISISALES